MSSTGEASREMTLDEWVERLPEIHRARRELTALRAALREAQQEMRTAGHQAFEAMRMLKAAEQQLAGVRAALAAIVEEMVCHSDCDTVTGKGLGLSENILCTPKCTCGFANWRDRLARLGEG